MAPELHMPDCIGTAAHRPIWVKPAARSVRGGGGGPLALGEKPLSGTVEAWPGVEAVSAAGRRESGEVDVSEALHGDVVGHVFVRGE